MSLTEFNQEEYNRNCHEEGFADGERSKKRRMPPGTRSVFPLPREQCVRVS